jgi:hypothetical protein
MSESEKKHGIEAMKKVVDFAAQTHKAGELSMADGKIDLTDVPNLLPPGMALVQLLAVVGQLPKEFGDLDEQEKAEIAEYAKVTYNIADDKLELIIQRGLKIAIELGDLVEDAVTGDAV